MNARVLASFTVLAALFASLAGCNTTGKSASSSTGAGGDIAWERDVEKGLARAKAENKFVFMDIYADWCGPCKMMDAQTFKDAQVRTRLAQVVAIKIDADKDVKNARKYGTDYLPTTVILDSGGAPVATKVGFVSAGDLVAWLDEAAKAP